VGLVDSLKSWFTPKNRLEPAQFRRAKPLRHPRAEWFEESDERIVVRLPLETDKAWVRAIAERAKWPDHRQYEFEEVGAFVWRLCDGQHTNEAITRKLIERYKMNRLEAEASLSAFLQMLSQRRLITLLIGTKK
jgi:hypothetical protein